jgi:ZIP family zinc transporter
MQDFLLIMIGILIPFVGTTLGALAVFCIKDELTSIKKKLLLGFAAGLMLAASIWSLIMPSIEMSENIGKSAWIPATVGLILGGIFLIIMDKIIPLIEQKNVKSGKSFFYNVKETAMLVFAIVLHNFPEGMAVGVTFASLLNKSSIVTVSSAFALSIGIAIQNIPEGAAVSLPTRSAGKSKMKSFIAGMLSGIVEPISAIITVWLAKFITPILPYLLSFAAGAMIYVVVEELIPNIQDEKSKIGTIGIFIGFSIMMILDIVF